MDLLMIHRYWEGAPPPVDYHDRLAALNPGIEIAEWTPETLPGWIVELADRTAGHVHENRRVMHRSNVARAGLLWELGGWWADHDLEPRMPFSPLPSPATAAHGNGRRCCCWLTFPRQHPTVGLVLAAIAKTEGPERGAASVSGCHVWNDVAPGSVARLPVRGWARHRAWTSRAS